MHCSNYIFSGKSIVTYFRVFLFKQILMKELMIWKQTTNQVNLPNKWKAWRPMLKVSNIDVMFNINKNQLLWIIIKTNKNNNFFLAYISFHPLFSIKYRNQYESGCIGSKWWSYYQFCWITEHYSNWTRNWYSR